MNKAQQSVANKMAYIINRIAEGPLVKEEHDEMVAILGRVKGDDLWSIGIRSYFATGQTDHTEFIAGLASQCMDDIFTMTCIVGQKAVIYLLRTVN